MSSGTTDLYRYFDADGRLLYVGISLSAVARAVQHKNSSHWWSSAVTMTKQTFDTRDEALAAERDAIRAERPFHNKIHAAPAAAGWCHHQAVDSSTSDPLEGLDLADRASLSGLLFLTYDRNGILENRGVIGDKTGDTYAIFCDPIPRGNAEYKVFLKSHDELVAMSHADQTTTAYTTFHNSIEVWESLTDMALDDADMFYEDEEEFHDAYLAARLAIGRLIEMPAPEVAVTYAETLHKWEERLAAAVKTGVVDEELVHTTWHEVIRLLGPHGTDALTPFQILDIKTNKFNRWFVDHVWHRCLPDESLVLHLLETSHG